MLLLVAQGLVLFFVSWIVWQTLSRLVIKNDLDNVPGPNSNSFLKGTLHKVFDVHGWGFHEEIGRQFGGVVRIDAPLGDRQLYVSDPAALHHILTKEQHNFEEHSSFFAINSVLFGDSLLSTLGERHRKQRRMLSPAFSPTHLRHMVPTLYEVMYKLGNLLRSEADKGLQEIDMFVWVTRAALEMIAQSSLGYSLDPLIDNSAVHPYTMAVMQLQPVLFSMELLQMYLLPILIKIGTPRFRRFIVDLLPFKNVRRLRDIIDTMHNTSVEIYKAKKHAIQEGKETLEKQPGRARDIMSILIKANMEASEKDKLPESEVLAQMSALIFAGTDTTSNSLSRTLHLLATHPEVQDKLRQEIIGAVQNNGGQDLSYDALISLPFLDAVCRETFRVYPPVATRLRAARKETVMPLYNPIKGTDRRGIREIVVPKDTSIILSIINFNRDPGLWGPDSYEWKPERWLSPVSSEVTGAPTPGVYSYLMTFFGGGRACIGLKLAELELKVGLSALLSGFRFAPSEKEIFWEMSIVSIPTIKGTPGSPNLPIKVIPL